MSRHQPCGHTGARPLLPLQFCTGKAEDALWSKSDRDGCPGPVKGVKVLSEQLWGQARGYSKD